MNRDKKHDLILSLGWAGGILALALAASLARKAGYIEPDTAVRVVIATIGLMVAWQGNRIPKTFVPSACARQAKRIAGWSMALSGLIYAGLYAFAPLHVAFVYGCGAIVAGVAVTMTSCLALRLRQHPA